MVNKHLLEDLGRTFTRLLRDNLRREGKDVSGDLIDSVELKVTEETNGFRLEVEALDYITIVDKGRSVGKFPPPVQIQQWASKVGIPESAVYPISKKIAEQGIEPTNIIEKTLRDFNIDKQLSELSEGMVKDVEKRIDQTIKNLNKVQ